MDYKFSKLENFIGNKKQIQEIKNFINNKNEEFLLLTGEVKTGKTELIKLIFNNLNLNYNYIIATNLPNNNNVTSFMNSYYKNYNIKHLLSKKYNISNNFLIIDNLELLNNSNKNIITELLKKKKIIKKKIIFIANKNYFKFNKLIYKVVTNIIQIKHPSNNEMLDFFSKNFNNINNLNIDNIICEYKNVNDILLHINNNKISGNLQNTNILYIIKKLLTTNYSFENIDNLYKYDKYKIPLLLYENYYNYLFNVNILENILESLILYDIIDNYMYARQNWELQNICGLIPTLQISNLLNNKNIQSDIKFTKYLNKISLISINRKSIYKYFKLFKINNIYKLLQIINYINDIDNITTFAKEKSINLKLLENISKIDKLNII